MYKNSKYTFTFWDFVKILNKLWRATGYLFQHRVIMVHNFIVLGYCIKWKYKPDHAEYTYRFNYISAPCGANWLYFYYHFHNTKHHVLEIAPLYDINNTCFRRFSGSTLSHLLNKEKWVPWFCQNISISRTIIRARIQIDWHHNHSYGKNAMIFKVGFSNVQLWVSKREGKFS